MADEYEVLQKARIYNPTSKDSESIDERRIFGGNPPSDVNFADIKYGWSKAIFDRMRNCEWGPEIVTLTEDARQYKELSKETRDSYNKSLAQIFSMDSFQSKNLSINIIEYVTDPMVSHALTRQAYDESLHAYSYGWLIDSVCGDHANDIYLLSSEDKELKHKNEIIVDTYESLAEHVTEETFIYAMFANQALEAIYFNSAFLGFYSLSVNKLMGGTTNMIKYINRDENNHTALFQNMIKTTFKERPYLFNKRIIENSREILHEACQLEVEWGKSILLTNDRVGLNEDNLEHYIKYLTNQVCKNTGLEIIYPEATENNMKWVQHYSRVNGVKAGFLEDESTDYAINIKVDDDYSTDFVDGKEVLRSLEEFCVFYENDKHHIVDIADGMLEPDHYVLVEKDKLVSINDKVLVVDKVLKASDYIHVSIMDMSSGETNLISTGEYTHKIPTTNGYITIKSTVELTKESLDIIEDAYPGYDETFEFKPLY